MFIKLVFGFMFQLEVFLGVFNAKQAWEEEDGFNGLGDGWKACEYSFVDNRTTKCIIQIDKREVI